MGTTPFRTKDGQVDLTPSQHGQNASVRKGMTPGVPTPLRDKLAINPEESFDDASDRFHQREMKETLKLGLSSLPQPKNDFEIVVPEDMAEEAIEDEGQSWVEDQADIDNQTAEEFRKRREAELKRRSQPVQRDLPRPTDMNHSVLRPLNSDPPLSDLSTC